MQRSPYIKGLAYIQGLAKEVARHEGLLVSDLKGLNIYAYLQGLESAGITIYWGCVQKYVSSSDTF